jgi:hypothetical protein
MNKEKVYLTNIVIAAGAFIIGKRYNIETLFWAGLAVLITTVISFYLASKIASIWMFVGKILGAINGKIIMMLFFYLVLTPLALIKKLLSSKPPHHNNTNWKTIIHKEENFKQLF